MSLIAALLIALVVYLLTGSVLATVVVLLVCVALGGGYSHWGPRR